MDHFGVEGPGADVIGASSRLFRVTYVTTMEPSTALEHSTWKGQWTPYKDVDEVGNHITHVTGAACSGRHATTHFACVRQKCNLRRLVRAQFVIPSLRI